MFHHYKGKKLFQYAVDYPLFLSDEWVKKNKKMNTDPYPALVDRDVSLFLI